jgi:outer membrane lipoprotein SlyB
VRMNDGRSTVVTQSDLGGIREGSYVRVTNGRAYLR